MTRLIIENVSGLVRRGLPMVLGAAFVWLLWHKTQTMDWGAIRSAFQAIPLWQWGAAMIATALSFAAIAQYDVIAHAHIRTGISPRAARGAGASAIALGQTIGFGPAVGAAVRWKLMPGLRHGQILHITAFVTLSFFVAWGLVVLPAALGVLANQAWLAMITVPMVVFGAALVLWRTPQVTIFGRTLVFPSILAMGHLVVLAVCDLICAGFALYILMPPEIAPSMPMIIAAFCIALAAGMFGGTPGGVGPFELALLTLLPSASLPELAAAIIAFRIVYYAIPCVLGAAYALWTRACCASPENVSAPRSVTLPEHAIAQQSHCQGVYVADNAACLIETPQTLTLFLGATQGHLAPLLPKLKLQARAQNRTPCLYKVDARDALVARKAGWRVAACAVEAVIDPKTFSLDTPTRRQLRRQLRKAEKSGVTVRALETPDWEAMTEIHCQWEDRNGPERGVTMGRFCPLYLRDKPLFAAFHNQQMVAFISAVEAPNAVSLDLMRSRDDAPHGTMQALVMAMITYARNTQRPEACLAALPHPGLGRLADDSAGLAQFKSSFAPKWRPLYFAAPNMAALALSGADLWRSVGTPPPLVRSTVDLWTLDSMIDTTIQAPQDADLIQKAG